MQKKLVSALNLSPVALPLREPFPPSVSEDEMARELGALGYAGFRHLRTPKVRWNPADLLVVALMRPDLDSRVTETLPWLVWRFADLDWQWVVAKAKALDLQNRLGFVVTVGRQLAERKSDSVAAEKLRKVEESRKCCVACSLPALIRSLD
jgi:hypothetical protein